MRTLPIVVRRAVVADLPAIVELLGDDDIEWARSGRTLAPTSRQQLAFAAIEQAQNHELVVLTERDERVLGTAQLVFIEGINWNGGRRCQIQGVRVHRAARGRGLGTSLVRWAIEQARREGCVVVQLSTQRSRHEAHRLYERLGFEATHLGFKLRLDQ